MVKGFKRTFRLTHDEAVDALRCMATHMFKDSRIDVTGDELEVVLINGVVRLEPSSIVGRLDIKEVIPDDNQFTALVRSTSDRSYVSYLDTETIDIALYSYVYSFKLNRLEHGLFERAIKIVRYTADFTDEYVFKDVEITLQKE